MAAWISAGVGKLGWPAAPAPAAADGRGVDPRVGPNKHASS